MLYLKGKRHIIQRETALSECTLWNRVSTTSQIPRHTLDPGHSWLLKQKFQKCSIAHCLTKFGLWIKITVGDIGNSGDRQGSCACSVHWSVAQCGDRRCPVISEHRQLWYHRKQENSSEELRAWSEKCKLRNSETGWIEQDVSFSFRFLWSKPIRWWTISKHPVTHAMFMFGSCVTRLKKTFISSSSAHCIGLSLEFWKMAISAANPGCDCHTALYIVVSSGNSKSLRQELGQVKMTTYGLLHKGGKHCHGSQRYHCLNVIFH